MNKSFIAISAILLAVGASSPVYSAELSDQTYQADNVEQGFTTTGLTGLYRTISPYSKGTGISATAYSVLTPASGGSTVVTPLSATIGLGRNVEISGVTRLYSAPGVTATGDTDIYTKFSFRSLGERMPAMALVLGATLPTASNAAAQDVTAASGHIIVSMGGETNVSDNWVVGMYANAGYHLIDPGTGSQNSYTSYSLGVMVPISDNQKLQGYAEIHSVYGKTAATVSDAPGNEVIFGLRLATRFLKIMGGIDRPDGAANSNIFFGVALDI